MNTYNERIAAMSDKLDFYGIPNEVNDCWGGAQIRFPWTIGDVACHEYTSGSENGYVETYQFPWDEEDVSALTPEETVDRIIQLYIKRMKELFISPMRAFLNDDDLE